MDEYLSIGKAAKFLGLSISTLRRWEISGKLISHFRTFGQHRRYKTSTLLNLSNNTQKDERKVVAYARVSTHKQKADLENQKQFLNNYCLEQKFTQFEVISDLGSGLNFKKKGLNKIIEWIVSREINTIILTYKDRLLRFGNEIIFKLCHIFDVKVVILNDNLNKTSEQEFSEDLCEIITVFSARLYGKRSHVNRKKLKNQ
jgi:predicted site-specific integrase-resolvase